MKRLKHCRIVVLGQQLNHIHRFDDDRMISRHDIGYNIQIQIYDETAFGQCNCYIDLACHSSHFRLLVSFNKKSSPGVYSHSIWFPFH